MRWKTLEVYSDTSGAHEPSLPRACGKVLIDVTRISCVQSYFRNDEFSLIGYPTGGYPYLVTREIADELTTLLLEKYNDA